MYVSSTSRLLLPGTGPTCPLPHPTHRRRRLARTDARSEAATSGPRPAPTTISTVTRLSASSCRAARQGDQDAFAGACGVPCAGRARCIKRLTLPQLALPKLPRLACTPAAAVQHNAWRSGTPAARGPAGSGTPPPRTCRTCTQSGRHDLIMVSGTSSGSIMIRQTDRLGHNDKADR